MILDLGGGGGNKSGIVLDSLAWAQEIWDLSLLSDAEFISTLLREALGSFAQILGERLTGGSNWSETSSASVRTFLPSRVREQLLNSRVFSRFHIRLIMNT